nr:MAG TPA: hypothetical protein [Caudoviricetes sp.]
MPTFFGRHFFYLLTRLKIYATLSTNREKER